MNDNLKIWNQVNQPPSYFLKEIGFGALKGKSDINPQWRLMTMTQAFGMVGHGWNYRIVRLWTETGGDGQMMAFSEVAVKTKVNGEWGEEFSGIGGSMLCSLANSKLRSNDEGYKMATTDALSVAFKAVGVAADIYFGNYDGSKYQYDYSQAYSEPQPPQRNPSWAYNDNGVRILRPNEFDAALAAVAAGKYDKRDLLDPNKIDLSAEQRKVAEGA